MAARVTRHHGSSGSADRTTPPPSRPALKTNSPLQTEKEAPTDRRQPRCITWERHKANAARRPDKSLTHDWIWSAIDALASRSGLTPSGLARLAGLDPTAFNRSKRLTAEGRPRWPSTESIAKILEATGTPLDAFATIELESPVDVSLDEAEMGEIAGVKIVAEIRGGVVLDWRPPPVQAVAVGGSMIAPPAQRRFAVTVGDSSLEPAYSVGNVLIVSEAAVPRAGDRVLVQPAAMPVLPRLLLATSATHVELGSFSDSTHSLCVRQGDLDWMARIILARQ